MPNDQADDDELQGILYDPPAFYEPLSEWIKHRDWLVATFGDNRIGASSIRWTDAIIAKKKAGEL